MSDHEQTDTEIIAAVEQHYKMHPERPYYASELGKHIRSKGLHIPTGVSVINYVRSRLENKLFVLQDPTTPSRIAIATDKYLEKIRHLIEGRGVISAETAVEFKKIPFALMAAFCRPGEDGKRILFHTKQPFRYVISSESQNNDYVLIPESYQPSNLIGVDIHKLDEAQRLEVYRHILEWARDNGVDLRRFYVDEKKTSPIRVDSATSSASIGSNALERLVAMQCSSNAIVSES